MTASNKSIDQHLQEIKNYVVARDIKRAEFEFVLFVNSANPEWSQVSLSPNITKIFHYIRNIHIIEGKDVFVNLRSQEISFGQDFLLNNINTPADLLFVIYHERNHVLVNKLYKIDLHITLEKLRKQFPKAPIDQLASDAEEVFVNALSHVVIPNEKLLTSTFGRKGYSSLRTPRPDLNFWGQCHEILAMHQSLFFKGLYEYSFRRWVQIYISECLQHSIKTEIILSPLNGESDGEVQGGPPSGGEKGNAANHEDSSMRTHTFPLNLSDPLSKILIDTSVNSVQELSVCNMKEEKTFEINRLFQRIFSSYTSCQDMSVSVRSPIIPSRLASRDRFAMSQGSHPGMYSIKQYPVFVPPRFYIYFDVSGSMNDYLILLPSIYKQLSYLTDIDKCFYFSTKIARVESTFTSYQSTGGTSFNSVAQHLIENKGSNAVIVSDGQDGLSEDNLCALRKQLTHLIYIHVGTCVLEVSPWYLLGKGIAKFQHVLV